MKWNIFKRTTSSTSADKDVDVKSTCVRRCCMLHVPVAGAPTRFHSLHHRALAQMRSQRCRVWVWRATVQHHPLRAFERPVESVWMQKWINGSSSRCAQAHSDARSASAQIISIKTAIIINIISNAIIPVQSATVISKCSLAIVDA